MASYPQLDAAGRSANRTLIVLALLLLLCSPAFPQANASGANNTVEVKKLYDARRWGDVVRLVPESSSEAADLELYRGLALAQLQQYQKAERTFQAGHAGHPCDGRFLVEMAGLAYREKRFSAPNQNCAVRS